MPYEVPTWVKHLGMPCLEIAIKKEPFLLFKKMSLELLSDYFQVQNGNSQSPTYFFHTYQCEY